MNKTLPAIKPNRIVKATLSKKDIDKSVAETQLLLGAMTNFLKQLNTNTDKEK